MLCARGVPGPGGCLVLGAGGVPGPGGMPGQGGVWSGVVSQHALRQTPLCKNITLPQTSFAGGRNDVFVLFFQIFLGWY